MEKFMPVSEVKSKLNSLLDDVESGAREVIVTRKGKPVAALVSAEWLENSKATLEIMGNPEFYREVLAAKKKLKNKKTKWYSAEEVFGEPL